MSTMSTFSVCLLTALIHMTTGELALLPLPDKEGVDVGMTIVAGAYLTFDQYEVIGLEMQAAFDGRLWVYLINGLVSYAEISHQTANETFVGKGKQALIEAGLQPTAPYFAVGHSLGGIFAYLNVRQYPELAQGVILWAASMDNNDIDTYPCPIITINGDMDGSMTMPFLHFYFRGFHQRVDAGQTDLKYRYPYTILSGVTHSQYATGEMPENVVTYWITPEVSNTTAREQAVNRTLTLMYYVMSEDDQERESYEKTFDFYYEEAVMYFDPIIEAYDLQSVPANETSPWVDETQLIIAALNGTDKNMLTTRNTLVARSNLSDSQPSLEVGNDGMVTTQTYVSLKPAGDETSYTSADAMEVKVKSSQAIVEALTGQEVPNNPSVYCRNVNEAAAEYVWTNLTSPIQKERYLKRNISMVFLDDESTASGPGWLLSQFVFDYDFEGRTLTMQSTNLITSTIVGDQFGGQHYCKQLSPARILEFIHVHALYENLY